MLPIVCPGLLTVAPYESGSDVSSASQPIVRLAPPTLALAHALADQEPRGEWQGLLFAQCFRHRRREAHRL